jgi:hypothetical protein
LKSCTSNNKSSATTAGLTSHTLFAISHIVQGANFNNCIIQTGSSTANHFHFVAFKNFLPFFTK